MKKVFRWIINAFLSMGRGDIFIKLGVHRYLPHIVVAFAFCTLSIILSYLCLLYTSPSPRDQLVSRMPSSA